MSVVAGAAGFAPKPPNENPPEAGAAGGAVEEVEDAAFPVAGGVKEGVEVADAGAVAVVAAGFPNEKVGAGGLAAGVVLLLVAPNEPNGFGLSLLPDDAGAAA